MTTLTQETILRLRRLPRALQYAALLRLRRRPAPPPPAGWPAITEQMWKSDPYLTLWGGWNVPQSSYGKEWGATGEGPGHLNGPILVDSYGQGMHVGRLMDNCRVIGLGSNPTNKWGERIYNQIDPVWRKCEFLGWIPEHYIYPGVLQGGLLEDVRFGKLGAHNACGSAWHWALRNIVKDGQDYTMETQSPELAQVESTRTFRRCKFHHIGNPYQNDGSPSGRWGAFTLEEVYAQLSVEGVPVTKVNTHISVESCEFIGGHLSWLDGNGKFVRSGRAMTVNGRPSLTVLETFIDYPDPHDGWAMRIADVDHVELRKCGIVQGKIEIARAKSVNIVDCFGAAKVTVVGADGKVQWAGSVAQGYAKGGR